MGIGNWVTKLTEHKIIDNLIAIWKKIKPSKTYWTVAIPTVAFILSQARSWRVADVIASYAERQVESSSHPLFWEIVNAIAIEFYDTASWELVWLGIGILLIITYAFIKEIDKKHQEEIHRNVKEKLQKDSENKLLQFKVEILERQLKQNDKLLKFVLNGWLVENIEIYITKKEKKNE